MRLTYQMLQAATGCSPQRAAECLAPLDEACERFGISAAPARLAAFLAQLAHESGSLRYLVELWGPTPAQRRYEGRRDLGNVVPGDGYRFRGRGWLQVTGRANYAATRDRLRQLYGITVPDFEAEPEALGTSLWGSRASAEWWFRHGLNALADASEFDDISSVINTGRRGRVANGADDRRARWETAKQAIQQFGSIDQ